MQYNAAMLLLQYKIYVHTAHSGQYNLLVFRVLPFPF